MLLINSNYIMIPSTDPSIHPYIHPQSQPQVDKHKLPTLVWFDLRSTSSIENGKRKSSRLEGWDYYACKQGPGIE